MGKIVAICVSGQKGTAKTVVEQAELAVNHGLVGDAHAGDWHRQVSLLALEDIEEFRRKGAETAFGDFGENLVVSGLDLGRARIGDRIAVGGALLEITQIGKECHTRCRIYDRMGDCIMPRLGVFAKVLRGGTVRPGDDAEAAAPALRAAVVTVSDSRSQGVREDESGDVAAELAEAAGYAVAVRAIVPDERGQIAAELQRLCDVEAVALVLTTGGTGFSPRDVTPEATLDIVERLCPGIPEAMRFHGLSKTPRAMLSRAVAGIRKRTLIVNLPGSPRAVRENLGCILGVLDHALAILQGKDNECATPCDSPHSAPSSSS